MQVSAWIPLSFRLNWPWGNFSHPLPPPLHFLIPPSLLWCIVSSKNSVTIPTSAPSRQLDVNCWHNQNAPIQLNMNSFCFCCCCYCLNQTLHPFGQQLLSPQYCELILVSLNREAPHDDGWSTKECKWKAINVISKIALLKKKKWQVFFNECNVEVFLYDFLYYVGKSRQGGRGEHEKHYLLCWSVIVCVTHPVGRYKERKKHLDQ